MKGPFLEGVSSGRQNNSKQLSAEKKQLHLVLHTVCTLSG